MPSSLHSHSDRCAGNFAAIPLVLSYTALLNPNYSHRATALALNNIVGQSLSIMSSCVYLPASPSTSMRRAQVHLQQPSSQHQGQRHHVGHECAVLRKITSLWLTMPPAVSFALTMAVVLRLYLQYRNRQLERQYPGVVPKENEVLNEESPAWRYII